MTAESVPVRQAAVSEAASGAGLGAWTGAWLAFVYTMLWPLFNIIMTVYVIVSELLQGNIERLPYRLDDMVTNAIYAFGWFLIPGLIVGILPSILIGLTTGFVIDFLLKRLSSYLSPQRANGLGVALATILVTLAHGGLAVLLMTRMHFTERDAGLLFLYAYFLGVPSIIYIIAAGRVSKKLYLSQLQSTGINNI